ncbi:hypothetical protein SAMN05421690_10495 [Nitrosomonas sp. Nm51]|uniref:hypothetical protein n=1 Tax=Nitrosomonas sp. Nm51 TaxID=133720 RepID=UPI0008BDCFF6|nr:hypothetical protein [Nitrosomonas sp. Nm51]SER65565.1 hypothetical protein SAMN05421690_10495 [Nitrosomonas sp. Nm51]
MIKTSLLIQCVYILAVLVTVTHAAVASESPGAPGAVPCDRQSEATRPCPLELPAETISKLRIDAGFGWGIFSGSIYNGNSEYTVTQLDVSMEPIHDHHTMEMTHAGHAVSHEPRIKQIRMNLLPLTKGAISMVLDDDVVHVHDFKWEVIKAYGYKKQ